MGPAHHQRAAFAAGIAIFGVIATLAYPVPVAVGMAQQIWHDRGLKTLASIMTVTPPHTAHRAVGTFIPRGTYGGMRQKETHGTSRRSRCDRNFL